MQRRLGRRSDEEKPGRKGLIRRENKEPEGGKKHKEYIPRSELELLEKDFLITVGREVESKDCAMIT